jgi:predicted metalloprotease with PDZ domain
MVHNWLPVKISFKGEPTVKYEWLFEGFPEYIGRKVLLENKLITTNDFIDFINTDLNKLADNPYIHFTYEKLDAQAAKRYGSLEKKVSYYRGALMAMNWDARIMENFPGKSLKDVMVELNVLARQNKSLAPADLFLLLKKYGIDGQSDFKQFIIDGNQIPVILPSFISGYELYTLHRPVFNLGFDIIETRKKKVLTGVEEHGPAWQVGLRNGMEVVRYHNISGSWPFRNPVTVVIKETGKAANEYSYVPAGKIISLEQVRKISTINNN